MTKNEKNEQNLNQNTFSGIEISPVQKQDSKNSKIRIIQKNLVYLIGLPQKLSNEKLLKQEIYMGQYGKINKVVVNSQVFTVQGEKQYSVYITYSHQKEAALAIIALKNFKLQNNEIKANYGTSKYCQFYLKKQTCINQNCVFQHFSAKINDTFNQSESKSSNVSHELCAFNILKTYKQDLLKESILKSETIFPNVTDVIKSIIQKINNPSSEKQTPERKKNKLINIQDDSQTIISSLKTQDSFQKNEENNLDQNLKDNFQFIQIYFKFYNLFKNDQDKNIIQKCFKQKQLNKSRFSFVIQSNEDNQNEFIKNYIISYLNQSNCNNLDELSQDDLKSIDSCFSLQNYTSISHNQNYLD